LVRALRIHLQGIKTAVATRMAYRGDFFISILIMLAMDFVIPLATVFIYQTGVTLPGWSMYEILLLQGVFLLVRGVAFPFFFGMVWNTIERVENGTFDLLLIKPCSTLRMVIVTGFDSEDLGKLLGGILLTSIALSQLPPPSMLQWVQFGILFIMALITMFGYGMILAGLGIVWIGNFRVYDIFFALTNFAMYPSAIFSKAIQTLILTIVPIAILGSIPASVLLDRVDWRVSLLATGSSLVFLLVSFWFWNWILKKYTSAGG